MESSTSGPQQRANRPLKAPGKNGFRYRPQFGIVVIVDSERDQERAYDRLRRAGFKKLRVVSV